MIYCICSSQVSNFFLSAETVILGCSWVAFKPVMACKMMHQIAYGFYLSIKKCSKLGQKSAAHFVSFFVYALLHRLSYAPRFCKLKDLIKIYICGTFQHYSICGREVKGFWIDSAP